jgi:hypothetical protein
VDAESEDGAAVAHLQRKPKSCTTQRHGGQILRWGCCFCSRRILLWPNASSPQGTAPSFPLAHAGTGLEFARRQAAPWRRRSSRCLPPEPLATPRFSLGRVRLRERGGKERFPTRRPGGRYRYFGGTWAYVRICSIRCFESLPYQIKWKGPSLISIWGERWMKLLHLPGPVNSPLSWDVLLIVRWRQ